MFPTVALAFVELVMAGPAAAAKVVAVAVLEGELLVPLEFTERTS